MRAPPSVSCGRLFRPAPLFSCCLSAVPTTMRHAWPKADKATIFPVLAEQFRTPTRRSSPRTAADGSQPQRPAPVAPVIPPHTLSPQNHAGQACCGEGIEGSRVVRRPTAIAFVKGEAVDAAKAINKFAT